MIKTIFLLLGDTFPSALSLFAGHSPKCGGRSPYPPSVEGNILYFLMLQDTKCNEQYNTCCVPIQTEASASGCKIR